MLNVTLVRITQLIALIFFTGTVMVYAAGLLLIPLAVLKLIVSALSPVLGGILATIFGIPALGWLVYRVYKLPALSDTIIDAGWSLVRLGADVFRKLDSIAHTAKAEGKTTPAGT